MPLVPAICTQCGAKLDVDSSKEATVCPCCNTAFITEKAISNYNTTNITNIGSLHADVVQIADERSIDNRVRSGDTFIKLGEYGAAQSVFDKLINECPYDARSWMGMTRVLSRNYTNYDITRKELNYIAYLYSNAQKVTDTPDKIGTDCGQYINTVKAQLDTLAQNTLQSIQQLKSAHYQQVQQIQNIINNLSLQRRKAAYPDTAVVTSLTIVVIAIGVIAAISIGIFTGIALMFPFGIGAAIVNKILNATWGEFCRKKVNRLDYAIQDNERQIDALNSKHHQEMNYYNAFLEKATGKEYTA